MPPVQGAAKPARPASGADPRPSVTLMRRLAAATGIPPEEALQELRASAREATEAPAYPLMQTLCRSLADPHRLLIASLLKRNPDLSGTELHVALAIAQPTVSHHLDVLRSAGLVVSLKEGKWVRYRLDPRYERLIP